MKEDISTKKFATVVLGSLPESYDTFLTSLNARKADELDWDNIKGLLIEEYLKRKEKNESNNKGDNALFTGRKPNFGRGRNQDYSRRPEHSRGWTQDYRPSWNANRLHVYASNAIKLGILSKIVHSGLKEEA
jgi:hypothetical protein